MNSESQSSFKREQRRTNDVARGYREKGYQVLVQPQLPFGNSMLRPDLIAISNDDKVVIEVVPSHRVKNNEDLTQLASIIERQPGWRFELVVIEADQAVTISLIEIENRIRQSTQMVSRTPDAALLYAWSAVEALLRYIADTDSKDYRRYTPLSLVKTLYSWGRISQSAFDVLQIAAEVRNEVAHGFLSKGGHDVKQVTLAMLKTAKELIDQQNQGGTTYTADELVEWFFDNYEDPANSVPYEKGYVYIFGGPYDAWDELYAQFPDVDESIIEEAAKTITNQSFEWVKKGQY